MGCCNTFGEKLVGRRVIPGLEGSLGRDGDRGDPRLEWSLRRDGKRNNCRAGVVSGEWMGQE